MKTIQQKINEGREYRTIAPDLEFRDDDGSMSVEGYATIFNTPYVLYSDDDGYTVREVVDPKAFEGCDMSDVILQVEHSGIVYARNMNGTLAVNPDEVGLKTRAELSGTQPGRELYEQIRGRYYTKMSMGFTVAEDEWTTTENRDEGTVEVLRTIRKFKKLYDVSVVARPANGETDIQARSMSEGAVANVKEEIRARKEAEEIREKQKQKIRILLEVQK